MVCHSNWKVQYSILKKKPIARENVTVLIFDQNKMNDAGLRYDKYSFNTLNFYIDNAKTLERRFFEAFNLIFYFENPCSRTLCAMISRCILI